MLPGVVSLIEPKSASEVEVAIVLGEGLPNLSTRITLEACRELGLKIGTQVFALIKAVAVDRIGF